MANKFEKARAWASEIVANRLKKMADERVRGVMRLGLAKEGRVVPVFESFNEPELTRIRPDSEAYEDPSAGSGPGDEKEE